jgi:predicted PurR-regulated permease PerM
LDLSIIPKLAGLLIPLAAIMAPVAVIWVLLEYRERQRRQLYETVKHYADRGLPLPRELLDPPKPTPQRLGNAARFVAFTLIGVGVGIALMFWTLELPNLMGIGGLVLCVGVAQLVALGLDRREAAQQQGDQRAA